jgi:hypothetical protein
MKEPKDTGGQNGFRFVDMLVLLLLIGVFVMLRLWRIDQSFEFWGDIARDHEKLMVWLQTGKPPLVGPNTSVLPALNQSAWFLYFIFPVFFLTKSALSMTYTVIILSVLSLVAVAYILRNHKARWGMYGTFLLLAIHPLIIEQQRTPWNPTFAIPFLFFALGCVFRIMKKYDYWTGFAAILSAVFSAGMTFSFVPELLAVMLLAYQASGRRWKTVLFHTGVSFAVVFLPNLVFELKNRFRFLLQGIGDIKPVAGQLPLHEKVLFFWNEIFARNHTVSLPVFLMIATLLAATFVREKKVRLPITGALLLTGLTLLLPFGQTHYYFGLLLVWFVVFSRTGRVRFLILTMVLAVSWIPSIGRIVTADAIRPLASVEECAKQFCMKHPGAYFVSSWAWHDMHSAHDHAFLLNKAGCASRDIVSFPAFPADKMAVAADQERFVPQKTTFYELEQFGPYEVEDTVACDDKISYFLMTKKKSD